MNSAWKPDASSSPVGRERIRERTVAWWRREGLVLWLTAPTDAPPVDLLDPPEPDRLERFWLDPVYRARKNECRLARTYFGGEAFPFMETNIGPGNLATFIGSEPEFAPTTVWYKPCITDPETHPPLRFDPANRRFREQAAIIEECRRVSAGRFPIGMPDLIENVDIVASLRDTQTLMCDLVERPGWVKEMVQTVNLIYFQVFDLLRGQIVDEWGGNVFSAFCIWGPGRTAKLQCDASAMFSRRMFDEIVLPSLDAQCRWLEYSLYHLDGTQACHHLDSLLSIPALDAIEWTPQAGIPGGGDPLWYDLYRRIKRGGKGVQAVGVKPEEVIPLLDAVGPEGMFIMCSAPDEATARELEAQVERYR
jgi:hypothetical protein